MYSLETAMDANKYDSVEILINNFSRYSNGTIKMKSIDLNSFKLCLGLLVPAP